MKRLLGLTLATCLLAQAPALAEKWEEVATNAVGDKFSVDIDSLQRKGDVVWYWEYRRFPQANNAFLDFSVPKPVHGALIYRSADCKAKTERIRRITVYDKEQKVIRKVDYGDRGRLANPMQGSSAYKVLSFACERAPS